jgi:tetratricopeptide (TPR) repeat protein
MAQKTARAKASSNANWTGTQAYSMAVICLVIGIAAGWFLKSSQAPGSEPVSTSDANAGSASNLANPATFGKTPPSAAEFKRIADSQVQPMVDQLRMTPNDPNLLAQIGNSYFDSGESCRQTNQECPDEFRSAIDYYERALKIQPSNSNVRTDMGIAWWEGLHDSDKAIQAFNTALSFEPSKPQTLQSLGIVKWKGKNDPKAAIAAWQKLLHDNPNYEKKDQIQQLIVEAQQQQ